MKSDKGHPDLDQDVTINKYKLDDECVIQASRYQYWAEAQADAKTKVDRAENKLKLTQAEALGRAKARLEKLGEKTTVDAIAATAAQDTEVKDAMEALLDAKEELYHLDAAVRSMDHRKSELDNLTKLYGSAYFSLPTGGSTEARQTPAESMAHDQRRSLNRNREGA